MSDIVCLSFNLDSKISKLEPSPAVEKDVALGDVRDIGANLYVEADQLSAEEPRCSEFWTGELRQF